MVGYRACAVAAVVSGLVAIGPPTSTHAQAQITNLACQGESLGRFVVRIDYNSRTVAFAACRPVPAQITERWIRGETTDCLFWGSPIRFTFDRLLATLNVRGPQYGGLQNFNCQVITPGF